MKKWSSKLASTRKTKQDRPLSKILTFGQRSTQKVKVKVKVNWSRVKVNGYWSGLVPGRAVDPLTSSYDVSMTWTRADVDMLAWLLMWTNDVI